MTKLLMKNNKIAAKGRSFVAKITLTGIEIITQPTRLVYEYGETLDLTGLVVNAVYSDASTVSITLEHLTVSGFNSHAANLALPITIGYRNFTSVFFVEILVESPFVYTEQANSITITDYKRLIGSPDVIIPEFINGKPVTAIGENAFDDKQLTSVEIPSSVTTIGAWAFARNSLSVIALSDNIAILEAGAFAHNDLSIAIIPSNITIIPNALYAHNTISGHLVVPEHVIEIHDEAFAFNNITSLALPSLTQLSGFNNNSILSVNIPETVISLGTKAFANNLLTEILIPSSVSIVNTMAFLANTLTKIIIGSNLAINDDGIMGDHGASFKLFYNNNSMLAGVYDYISNSWTYAQLPTPEGYFEFDSNSGMITDYNIDGGMEIVIPSTIGGIPVTGIAPYAFADAPISMSFLSLPTKTTYSIGEPLLLDGLVVEVVFDDLSTDIINHTELTVTGFDSSSIVVSQVITVTYRDLVGSFSVSVV